MKTNWKNDVAVLFCVAAVACVLTGCGSDDSDVAVRSLALLPGTSTLNAESRTVTLTVSGDTSDSAALPLTWTVTTPGLGSISATSGWSAVYTMNEFSGTNIVSVRDSDGNEAFASVSQTWNESVFFEIIDIGDGATTRFSGRLAHSPVLPATLVIETTVAGGEIVFRDDGFGNLNGTHALRGAVNHVNGDWFIDMGPGIIANMQAIYASYQYRK